MHLIELLFVVDCLLLFVLVMEFFFGFEGRVLDCLVIVRGDGLDVLW